MGTELTLANLQFSYLAGVINQQHLSSF